MPEAMNATVAARPGARCRLYIDESGDHSYNLLDEPSHRYLGLLDMWFWQADDYVEFADNLAKFRRAIFGPAHPVRQACLLGKKKPLSVT